MCAAHARDGLPSGGSDREMAAAARAIRAPVRRRAFSLLEVLFSVALFGAVVTFILSAEAGLVAGNKTAANMTQAMALARCRMTELEDRQLRLGFPEIEEKDENVACCDDKEVPGFSCEWAVDRVKLPEVTGLGGDAGLSSLLGGGLDVGAGSPSGSPLGGGGLPPSIASPAGSILVNPMGGAQIDFDGGLAGVGSAIQSSLLQSTGGAGAQGLLSMVFSLVYPSLKPVLEAAIRRITVVVRWKEGRFQRDITLVQYVTNPSRAGLAASMLDAGAFTDGGAAPSVNTGGILNGVNSLLPNPVGH